MPSDQFKPDGSRDDHLADVRHYQTGLALEEENLPKRIRKFRK
jgi:hypothetical protein